MVLERGSTVRPRPATGIRAGLATLGLVVTIAGGALVAAGSAAAHATLTGSTPGDGETVDEPPTEIVLEFNEPVQGEFVQVAVLDAAENHYETGDAEVNGTEVIQAVGDLPAGGYQVSYRIGSADGHPVSGTIEFTVAEGTAATPEVATPSPEAATPSPEAVEDDTQETATSADESSAPLWLALATVALAATAAALIIARRRPGGGPGGSGTDTGR